MVDLTHIMNFTEIAIKKFFLLPMNNNFDKYKNEKSNYGRIKGSLYKPAVNNLKSDCCVNSKHIRHINGDSEGICFGKVKLLDLEAKLDISYISSNIIVCSYPISFSKENKNINRSLLYKKFYRNGFEDLIDYLNMEVGAGNWKIFNLKIEYKNNEDYTDDELYRIARQNAELPLLRGGWLDHQPPPLIHLFQSVAVLEAYLNYSSFNVAVIHCKMGKGRSGCLVVAYLMKHQNLSLKEALELFKTSRFKYGIIKGVTIKSQLRFLKYFEFINNLSRNEKDLNEILCLSNSKLKFKLTSFEIINPNYLFFGFNTGSCSSKSNYKDNYYFEIKLQTYNKNRDRLINIYCFDIYNKQTAVNSLDTDFATSSILSKIFSEDTTGALLDYSDIKICITIKATSNAMFSNTIKYFLEKKNKLTVSYWLNLYIESMLDSSYGGNGGPIYANNRLEENNGCVAIKRTSSVTVSFEEADNMSNKVGIFNSPKCILNLFEAFKITWSLI